MVARTAREVSRYDHPLAIHLQARVCCANGLLAARVYREIVVAAHSCILFTLINAILGPPTPGEGVAAWMRTGEMRSLRVAFSEGPDPQVAGIEGGA